MDKQEQANQKFYQLIIFYKKKLSAKFSENFGLEQTFTKHKRSKLTTILDGRGE